MSAWDLDLLGDPIPEGLGRRGRPPHLATIENRRKVVGLAGVGRKPEEIAAALGVSMPTLRRYYFRELRALSDARFRLEGKLLAALLSEVDKGNVSAIDKLWKRLDRHELGLLANRVADRGATAPPKKEKLGKKAAAKEAAGQVSGKFAPPPSPRLLN